MIPPARRTEPTGPTEVRASERRVDTPVALLRYRLTRADALAWAVLPREWSRRKLWAVLGLAACAGAILAAVEGEGAWPWAGRIGFVLGLSVVFYGVAALVMTLAAHRRARQLLPMDGPAETADWGDHLAVRQAGRQFSVAPEAIHVVIVTEEHLFIDATAGVVILPLSAFDDAAHMRAFAARWDGLSAAV